MSSQMCGYVRKHQVWIILFFILGAGFIQFISHLDMPIVRNAAIYARIADRIDLAGDLFNASQNAYNKPLGFAYLSLPWTKSWGLNTGIQFTSFLFASLWIVSLVPLYRRLSPTFKAPDNMLSWFVLITSLNPIVYYQFMSGYPDLLFALSFLWGAYFLDRFLSEDVKWYDGVFIGLAFLFSVWVKHNGFIFLPMLALFLVFRFRIILWMYQNRRMELVLGIVSFLIFLLVIALAQAGIDFELFNLKSNIKNYTQGPSLQRIFVTNLPYFLIYLILCFSVFVPFVLPLQNRVKCAVWYLSIILFLASILFYKGSKLNIRYFLALTPFFSMIIIANLGYIPKAAQRMLLIFFIFANCFTTLYYNNLPFNSWSKSIVELPKYDNLRLVKGQKQARESISLVNKTLKEINSTQLFFFSNYYVDALWRTWEKSGFFDPNVNVIYSLWWKESLWDECQCDKAVVYDYRARSFKRYDDKEEAKIFTPVGYEVFIATKPDE